MCCMMCGAEMTLIKVVEDETFMLVRGFERHAYMCSLCNETEQRLVFNKRAKERETETAPGPASVGPARYLGIFSNRLRADPESC